MHCVAPLLLAFVTASAAQDIPIADPAPRALTVEYHDGEKLTRLLRATGAMWTPRVRHIPGADTARDGVPLAALHLSHVVTAAARQVEEIVVRDLEIFHKSDTANQPGAFAAWLANAIHELEQWRERIRRQLR